MHVAKFGPELRRTHSELELSDDRRPDRRRCVGDSNIMTA